MRAISLVARENVLSLLDLMGLEEIKILHNGRVVKIFKEEEDWGLESLIKNLDAMEDVRIVSTEGRTYRLTSREEVNAMEGGEDWIFRIR